VVAIIEPPKVELFVTARVCRR